MKIALAILGIFVLSASPLLGQSGSWTPAEPPHFPGFIMVRLLDGRILNTGGGLDMNPAAEIFDPVTGHWTPTGSMNIGRLRPAASLLPDGRVLVVGGFSNSPATLAEIYDPVTGNWSMTGSMTTPASNGAGAVLMPNGKVLVYSIQNGTTFAAEIFDPTSGRFTPEPLLSGVRPRYVIAAALLADGRVLIKGTGATIYDPATGALFNTESMPDGTLMYLRLLPDGRVLARGVDYIGTTPQETLSFYSPQTNTGVGSSAVCYTSPNDCDLRSVDVLLSNGLVMIHGLNTTTLLDPLTDHATPIDNPVSVSGTLLLDDGRVLATGVRFVPRPGISNELAADIYTPPAYNNPGPVIGSVTGTTPTQAGEFINLDIRGSGFLPNSFVQLGQTKLVTIYLGSQRLVAFVPPGVLSSLNIRVTNPNPGGGSADSGPVQLTAPQLTIRNLSPNTAVAGSELSIVVSGNNLGNPTSASFSGAGVAVALQTTGSSAVMTLNVAVSSDAAAGSRSLTVVTAYGTATVTNALQIQRPATPPATAPLPITQVEAGAVRSGYVVVTPDAGSAAPISTVTFGIVRGGAVQSQAAILPTAITGETSILVDVIPGISRNLGLAIANPASSAASITLTLRDDNGAVAGSAVSLSIPGQQQLARFITELFPSGSIGAAFRGSITIQSSTPVSVLGVRFSGVELSSVPTPSVDTTAVIPSRTLTAGSVTDTPRQGTVGGTNAVMFPQFGISGGWATTLGLVNTSSGSISGRVDIFDTGGNPMAVTLNGATKSTFVYSIPARGTLALAPRDSNGQSPF